MDSLLEFANGFHWERGTTFMSAPQHVATALGSYIAVSFLLQYLMRSRPAFKLTGLVCLHNAGLCLLSVCMFLGTVYEIASIAFGHYAARPAFGALCDPDRVVLTGSTRFPFWSYIFYLSKYWEMLDTYILALKKKPLTFLQMYHHFIIVVLCWLWLDDSWSIHWVAVSLNSLVHVFMYYYFSLSALGYRIWWKSYLTAFQLVQFTIVTVLIGAWYFLALDISITCEILMRSLSHSHYVSAVARCSAQCSAQCSARCFCFHAFRGTFPFITHTSNVCTGTPNVAHFSNAVDLSFLYLFGNFYVVNYLQGKGDKGSKDEKDGKKSATAKKAD
eukprot:m.542145 g.542145  ORF g.542145 m.542145 type:complete len:331 (-) comp57656_c0_seq12:1923-2915(-)